MAIKEIFDFILEFIIKNVDWERLFNVMVMSFGCMIIQNVFQNIEAHLNNSTDDSDEEDKMEAEVDNVSSTDSFTLKPSESRLETDQRRCETI